MALNCTQLDGAYRQLEAFATGTDAGVVALIVALGAVSGVLLTHGERLVRPLGGALAGLGGALVAFVGSQAAGFACELRVAAAGVAGVLLAVLALCLLKTGLFLLGAAGLGVVGHLAYVSVPFDDSGAPFELMGLSGYYFITVGACVVVGGVVSQIQKKHFVRTVSSALGGSGLGTCTHIVLARSGATSATPAAPLLVALLGAAGGCVAQSRLEAWRKRRKEHRRKESV